MDLVKVTLARDLLKEKKFSQVLIVGNDILANEPANLDVLWLLSVAHCELGNDSSAESYLRRYLDYDPSNVDASLRLAGCLRRRGYLLEAKELLEKCPTSIKHVSISGELASLYLELGNSDLAILHATESLQLDPHSFVAQMVLGSTFILLGTPREALKYLEAARENCPSNPQVHINLAEAYGLLGERHRQVECLSLAVMCDGSLIGLQLRLGKLYLETKQLDLSVAAFSHYLRVEPNNVEAIFGLARACQAAGEHELAKQHFLSIVKVQPKNLEAWKALCQCFSQLGDSDKAKKCASQITQIEFETE